MDLNHKTFGQGNPLVILHGLFGTLDNWQTLGKRWAEEFMVYLLDQRNHGRSPHTPEITYPLMAEDVREFLSNNWVHHTHILGHSMGGKTAMHIAVQFPDLVDKLVVIDIAPKRYPGGHNAIFNAMFAIDLKTIKDRQEAEKVLSKWVPEMSVRQFLLKNLRRQKDGGYQWKMNLPVIYQYYQDILAGMTDEHTFEGPTLFVRGEKSGYMLDEDEKLIKQIFPNAQIETIQNAGHWVHAEQPEALFQLVQDFLHD